MVNRVYFYFLFIFQIFQKFFILIAICVKHSRERLNMYVYTLSYTHRTLWNDS